MSKVDRQLKKADSKKKKKKEKNISGRPRPLKTSRSTSSKRKPTPTQSFLRLGACGFAAAAAAATVGVGGVHCAPSAGTAAETATGTAVRSFNVFFVAFLFSFFSFSRLSLPTFLDLIKKKKNLRTKQKSKQIDLSRSGIPAPSGSNPDRDVIFVLGGPGSGKGTQCARLVADFPGVVHLSAGDLLRAHTKSGTPDGDAVAGMIANGQIVPSSVTISLLEAAMAAAAKEAEEDKKKGDKAAAGGGEGGKAAPKHRFLVDGFPRNDENRAAYESLTGSDPALVLFFDCPEAVMRKRLLGRGQGRTDDNDETIKKRFRVFVESSVPVVEYYEKKGKVAKIDADRGPEEVYADVKRVFASRTGAAAAAK